MKKNFSYTIEKATKKDWPAILRLHDHLADHLSALDGDFLSGVKSRSAFKKFLEKILINAPTCLLVVRSQNKAIGYFLAFIRNEFLTKEKKVGFIADAFLLEKFRGYGIATEAIGLVLDWLKEQKVKRVELSVLSGNAPALRLWKKLGFEENIKTLKREI